MSEVESPGKIYVEVDAVFTKDGGVVPKKVFLDDDTAYEIQKITEVKRAASLIAGATGLRYTVYVDGFKSYIFYGDNHRWFIEGKRTM